MFYYHSYRELFFTVRLTQCATIVERGEHGNEEKKQGEHRFFNKTKSVLKAIYDHEY